jgi:hypothetical protein
MLQVVYMDPNDFEFNEPFYLPASEDDIMIFFGEEEMEAFLNDPDERKDIRE